MHLPQRAAMLVAALAALGAIPTTAAAAARRPTPRRPPAPRLLAPTARVVTTRSVTFRWTARRVPALYQLRLSRSARFVGVLDRTSVRAALRPTLAKGTWYWKVRVRLGGTRLWSSWSGARRVVVRPAVDIIPPTRPGPLTAPVVGENAVDVAFGTSRDEFGVTAYQVLANGHVVATVASTTAHIEGLDCATTYTLAARALDAVGHRGRTSPVANVRTHPCTDRLAPTAPTSIDALTTSDTQVALSWPDGSDPEGNLGGYVVTRNGVELGRPIGAGYIATNLRANTTYTFAVRSRDRAGHLSDAAATTLVTTAPPLQATGRVHAFLLATTEQSWTDFRDHYTGIAWIQPTFYTVNLDGTINGDDDRRITEFAQERGVKVLPRFETQDTATIHNVLANQTARATLIDAIADEAADEGYDGINLDFEAGLATDRQLYASLVQELATRLHAQGQLLSVCVSATKRATTVGRAGFYDYDGISQAADDVFVMAWNEHWSTSAPGALASVGWVGAVMQYMATFGRNAKITFGTHLYGMDWPQGARAQALEFPDVHDVLDARGATAAYDAAAHEPMATYTAEDGTPHTIYWADAASVAERAQMALDRGFGIGLWRLGREDQTFWDTEVVR